MQAELPFGAIQLFCSTHYNRHYTVKRLFPYKSMINSPFYCKGFGAEMGAGEWAEFCAATQHSQHRQ